MTLSELIKKLQKFDAEFQPYSDIHRIIVKEGDTLEITFGDIYVIPKRPEDLT